MGNNDVVPKTWIATVEDAGDGSGDVVIAIPDEVLAELGWNEDTELKCSVLDDGSIEIQAV